MSMLKCKKGGVSRALTTAQSRWGTGFAKGRAGLWQCIESAPNPSAYSYKLLRAGPETGRLQSGTGAMACSGPMVILWAKSLTNKISPCAANLCPGCTVIGANNLNGNKLWENGTALSTPLLAGRPTIAGVCDPRLS